MKRFSFLTFALFVFCATLPSAFAAETVPTANQPDNGFYEGRDPEWATLHSTDARGTTEHREYHREAVKDHLAWHAENKTEQGSSAFQRAHRIFHQLRNMLHRQFHTAPVTP